jgi:hypothetical protein
MDKELKIAFQKVMRTVGHSISNQEADQEKQGGCGGGGEEPILITPSMGFKDRSSALRSKSQVKMQPKIAQVLRHMDLQRPSLFYFLSFSLLLQCFTTLTVRTWRRSC